MDWKRILCLLLCLSMVSCALPAGALAEEAPSAQTQTTAPPEAQTDAPAQEEEDENVSQPQARAETSGGSCGAQVYWEFDPDTGTLRITGSGLMQGYDYEDVPWYDYMQQITAVEIAQGVTSVGRNTFLGALNLARVTLPEGLISIGYAAFKNCKALKALELPQSLDSIGDYAFYKTGFEEFVITGSVRSIPQYCFSGCANLRSITIPAGVSTISFAAFEDCSSLTDVYYLGSESQWGTSVSVYSGNNAIKNATYHFDIQEPTPEQPEIGGAYWHFDPATGKLTLTGNCDFESFETPPWKSIQEQVRHIEILDGVTHLPGGAFSGCMATEKITMAASVTWMESSAFSSFPAIETAGPIGSGCDYEFGWSVGIPAFAFRYMSSIHTVYLPGTIVSVSADAFDGCSGITDVYHACSQSQWAQASVSTWHNGYFVNADHHFAVNDTMTQIRFYESYDALGEAACFAGEHANALVTDATAASFTADPEALVGQYVLVSFRRDADGVETLVDMKALTARVGTLSAVSETEVTVSGETYALAPEAAVDAQAVGKQVLCHLQGSTLLALEVLQTGQGVITSWEPAAGTLTITLSRTSEEAQTFVLSALADASVRALLGEEASQPGKMVSWTADSIGQLYSLEWIGFTNTRDGWCFANNGMFFGYYDGILNIGTPSHYFPEERYAEVFGPAYVATAKSADDEIFQSMMPVWGGNCLGMCIMAALIYDGQLDLDDFAGSNEFSCVNRYYTELIASSNLWQDIMNQDLRLYARSDIDSEVTKMIERYQILYNGGSAAMSGSTYDLLEDSYMIRREEAGAACQVYDHNPDGDYVETVFHRIRSSDTPFIICLIGGNESVKDPKDQQFGHTVMTRTDTPPKDLGDGWYRVYVYDPNKPYMPQDYVNDSEYPLVDFYCNGDPDAAYVDMNIRTNTWRYTGCASAGQTEKYMGANAAGQVEYFYYEDETSLDGVTLSWLRPDIMYIYSPEDSGYPLSFDGTASWRTRWDDYTKLYFTDMSDVIAYAREKDAESFIGPVAAIQEGVAWELTADVQASPNLGLTADGTGASGGSMTLPYSQLRLEMAAGSDVSLVGTDFAFNIHTDGAMVADISMTDGNVTVTGTDGGEVTMQLTHLYSNAEYTSVVARGALEAGDTATLRLDGNAFAGAFTGEGSLELLTDNHSAPDSLPLQTLDESAGTVEVADVTDIPLVRVALEGDADTVYADGQPYAVEREEDACYAMIPAGTAYLTSYTWHIGEAEDVHTHYPVGMQVWQVDDSLTARPMADLENLLQYSGSSIRITGNKGIRMITSLTHENKAALTGQGLGGFTLEEYGTALCWATDLAPGEELVLGRSYTRSNYAYKKDVADPVFANTDTLTQYTNVLVGFTDEQCAPDIVMRPYIILRDAQGSLVTLYGGAVHRSIGYIAWQNRAVFAPGSDSYEYVWHIIHQVYGDLYDEEYVS